MEFVSPALTHEPPHRVPCALPQGCVRALNTGATWSLWTRGASPPHHSCSLAAGPEHVVPLPTVAPTVHTCPPMSKEVWAAHTGHAYLIINYTREDGSRAPHTLY